MVSRELPLHLAARGTLQDSAKEPARQGGSWKSYEILLYFGELLRILAVSLSTRRPRGLWRM